MRTYQIKLAAWLLLHTKKGNENELLDNLSAEDKEAVIGEMWKQWGGRR